MKHPLVATKEGLFSRMQMIMEEYDEYIDVSPYIKKNFVLLRIHAEELAHSYYKKNKTNDVSLDQIYKALCMTGELTKNEATKLLALEENLAKELRWDYMCPGKSDCLDDIPWISRIKDDFSAQLLAGAVSSAITGKNLSIPAKIGAVFGGPILLPYVEWLLHRTEILGIKRLYFIARDGYILKRIADVLISHLQIDIKTFYIYGSRRAWRIPSYEGKEGELRELIRWSYAQHMHSAEDLADVLQVDVEEIRPFLIPEFADKGRKLTFDELTACVFNLDKSQNFRCSLKNLLSSKRQLVVDYLKQEIDVSNDDFAFVELGGGGLTQICLSRIMQDFYDGQIRTFFYKMDWIHEMYGKCIFYDFFPSRLKNDLIIEMVCRAAEGQTEGYISVEGKVVPIKKQGEAEFYLKHGYDDYIKGIDAFTAAYIEAAVTYRPSPCIKASLACMAYIGSRENNNVMDFFAQLPNRLTGREEKPTEFAPPLTKKQVQDLYVRYADGILGAHYEGTDFELSLKRSTPFIKHKVEKYKKDAWKIRLRWLSLFPEILDSDGFKAKGCRSLPYSCLGKRVLLYGAGKRGRRWYKELSADKYIEIVQWLDKDYINLSKELPVTGDIDSLGQVEFDWVMMDFADAELLEKMIQKFVTLNVPREKIYNQARINVWVKEWINYLHV